MAGIHIMAIPVGDLPDMYEIHGVVSSPYNVNIFPAKNILMLKQMVQQVPDAMCNGKLTSRVPEPYRAELFFKILSIYR